MHQQIVQRRAVAVVDRHAQHVQRRCPGRDAQRDALIVVQRAEIEAEPDHHDGVREGGDERHQGRPLGPEKAAGTVASQHRRGIIRHRPPPQVRTRRRLVADVTCVYRRTQPVPFGAWHLTLRWPAR